jgi:hypothetical protein
MRGIRERGVAIASVIDKDFVGIAAPVFAAPDPIAAALTLARIRKEVDEAAIERLTKLAISAARNIENGCSEDSANRHLDQSRLLSHECFAQNTFKCAGTVDAAPIDPMTRCEGDKVDCWEFGSECLRQTKLRAEFFQRLIPTISDDHEGYGQLELAGRPQALNAVHAGAIPEHTDHFLSGVSERNAYSCR